MKFSILFLILFAGIPEGMLIFMMCLGLLGIKANYKKLLLASFIYIVLTLTLRSYFLGFHMLGITIYLYLMLYYYFKSSDHLKNIASLVIALSVFLLIDVTLFKIYPFIIPNFNMLKMLADPFTNTLLDLPIIILYSPIALAFYLGNIKSPLSMGK